MLPRISSIGAENPHRNLRLSLFFLMALASLSIKGQVDEALVYVSSSQGHDAVMVHLNQESKKVFTCASANEMILTPTITRSGTVTFAIDAGTTERRLGLLELNGFVEPVMENVATLPRIAWPSVTEDKSIYFVMPAESGIERVTSLFRLREGSIEPILSGEEEFRYFWPLLSPKGDRIVVRQSKAQADGASKDFFSRILLMDLKTDAQRVSFVDQPVYLEQWVDKGIVISQKLPDAEQTRVYLLVNADTGAMVELYRGAVMQARFTWDLTHLAVVRPEPKGSPFFDIFVQDLATSKAWNVTRTEQISESLIGWFTP